MPIPIGVLAVLGAASGGGNYFAKSFFQSSFSTESGAFGVSSDNSIYFLARSNSSNQWAILTKIATSGATEWQTRLATLTPQGNENQKFEYDSSGNPVVHMRTTSSNDLLQQVASNGSSSSFATSATGSSLTPSIRNSGRASSGFAMYGNVSSAGGDCALGYLNSSGVIQWWRRIAFTGNTNDQFNCGFFNTSSSLIEAYGSVQDGGFVPRPFLARVDTGNSVSDFYRYANTNQGDNFSVTDVSSFGSDVYMSVTGSGIGSLVIKLDSNRNVSWARMETSLGGQYSASQVIATPDGGVIHYVVGGSGNSFVIQYNKLNSSGGIVFSRRITTTNNMSFYGGQGFLDATGALIMTASYNNASTNRVETVLFRVNSDGTISTPSFSLRGFTWTWVTHTGTYDTQTSNWSRTTPSLAANTSFTPSAGSLSTTLTTSTQIQDALTTF